MKTLLFFLFLSFSFSTFAQQPFAPIGAKWYYTPHCLFIPTANCGYFTFESVADTLIDNQMARKIIYTKHNSLGSEVIPEATVVMYGDGDKIYYHFENEFHVLYDFTLEIGDTININLGPFANFYQTGSGNIISNTETIQAHVTSTEVLNINNENLRILSLSNILDNNPNAIWGFWELGGAGKTIERIGNTRQGLFGESLTQILAGATGELRCYEDPNFSYKNPDFNFPCDYISDLNAVNNIETIHFSISPNPTSNSFFIKNKTSETSQNQIQLFDFKGEIILEKTIHFSKNQSIEIQTNHFPSGIYFLKISDNNESSIQKIVINH